MMLNTYYNQLLNHILKELELMKELGWWSFEVGWKGHAWLFKNIYIYMYT